MFVYSRNGGMTQNANGICAYRETQLVSAKARNPVHGYMRNSLREMAESTQKCSWCSKQKVLSAFRVREFASGSRHIKTCFECEPKKSQNRKEWVKSEKGQKWKDRTEAYDNVIESKRVHRESDLKRRTDEAYRTSDAGIAAQDRKWQKVRDNPDLLVMHTISCKISGMAHGLQPRGKSKNVLCWTGFADSNELMTHLRNTAEFDLEEENWHVDHKIAKLWYQYEFDGSELRRVTVTEEAMKRCWHRDNLQALKASDNIRKCIALPSDDVLMKSKSLWPPHWKELPSQEYRRAMYRRVCQGEYVSGSN